VDLHAASERRRAVQQLLDKGFDEVGIARAVLKREDLMIYLEGLSGAVRALQRDIAWARQRDEDKSPRRLQLRTAHSPFREPDPGR
jgi:hypothetical protein